VTSSDDLTTPSVLSPGSILGEPSRRYQIVRAVGRGGMGEVYEATQVQLARRVALKTIRAELASKPELLARFRREAESAAALGHPNLVQVTDFQANPGEAAFLVMEMLDGTTLAHVLESEGRLDPARAAFIAVQLLSGLAAAHRAGIVHRDVKPANIFLQSTSVMRDLVKVLDFGVAKLALDATPGARAMTQAGQVLGTLSYMAPEQAMSGAAIDARTDIFGVGATLFHALSGVRPFDATEPGGGRTPLERIAPWVHRDLAAVIERALQRSPDARWSTADDMATALQPFAVAAAAPSSPSAPPAAPGSAPRAGWDPAAIGRLEAPTGGSSFGASSFGAPPPSPAFAPTASLPTGYAPTGFAPPGSGPTASGYSPTGFGSQTPPPPGVSASAPPGAVPLAMPPYGYGGYGQPPPPAMPSAMQSGPYASYPPGQLQPQMPMHMHGAPPRRSGPPWWIFVVVIAALGVLTPYAFSFFAIRNATNPDTIATNVEREVLKQPKQPCPQLEQCKVTTEEHGLTYNTCTNGLPSSSTYRVGEMILGGDDKRIAIVTGELGNKRHRVRFLTAKQESELGDDDIIGRLCRPTSRLGSGQTVP
jgi:serine/threonine-protein kinase